MKTRATKMGIVYFNVRIRETTMALSRKRASSTNYLLDSLFFRKLYIGHLLECWRFTVHKEPSENHLLRKSTVELQSPQIRFPPESRGQEIKWAFHRKIFVSTEKTESS